MCDMPAARRIRVMTWNLRAAIGPGPFPDRWWSRISAERLAAIGSFIGDVDADLVALQEVALLSRNGDLVDNAGDLGRQLGMEVRFAAVRTFEVAEDGASLGAGCYGNALLSRAGFRTSRTVAPAGRADGRVRRARRRRPPPGRDPLRGCPTHSSRAALPAAGGDRWPDGRLDPLQPYRLRRAPAAGRSDAGRLRRCLPGPPARRSERSHRDAPSSRPWRAGRTGSPPRPATRPASRPTAGRGSTTCSRAGRRSRTVESCARRAS